MSERLIALAEVEKIVGVKRSKIYSLMGEGQFPRTIKIGKSARWHLPAVEEWVRERAAAQGEEAA